MGKVLFGARKRLFLVMCQFRFLSEASWETVTFAFIFYAIVFFLFRFNRLSGQVGWVFTNGPGDLGSIPGCVMPKTLKTVLDTSLLKTQKYKVPIKGKVEQSRERSRTLLYNSR